MTERMRDNDQDRKPAHSGERGSTPPVAAELVPAWEEIEAGRYMPRRTRGSFPGRELG